MAVMDHTARARLPKPFRPLGPPPEPGRTDPQRAERHARLTKIAETALAIGVLQRLLSNSEAFHRAMAENIPPGIHHWPLNSTQVEGLHAALHVLRQQHDELLRAEGIG